MVRVLIRLADEDDGYLVGDFPLAEAVAVPTVLFHRGAPDVVIAGDEVELLDAQFVTTEEAMGRLVFEIIVKTVE